MGGNRESSPFSNGILNGIAVSPFKSTLSDSVLIVVSMLQMVVIPLSVKAKLESIMGAMNIVQMKFRALLNFQR